MRDLLDRITRVIKYMLFLFFHCMFSFLREGSLIFGGYSRVLDGTHFVIGHCNSCQ